MSNELERCRQAIQAIRQTLEDKPNSSIARYDLGMLYLRIGDRAQAINQYRLLKEIDGRIAQKLFEQIFPGQGPA
jgi:Flp pilus assembly protein TadD